MLSHNEIVFGLRAITDREAWGLSGLHSAQVVKNRDHGTDISLIFLVILPTDSVLTALCLYGRTKYMDHCMGRQRKQYDMHVLSQAFYSCLDMHCLSQASDLCLGAMRRQARDFLSR